ncbi:MAG: DUF2207 domain-containing protein [Proteobacteria bacterium]|nr:MAG: DUF2207 domain-containing protein [Pseudomonadota bacterium]
MLSPTRSLPAAFVSGRRATLIRVSDVKAVARLLLSLWLVCGVAHAREEILSFASDIEVLPDATVSVTETIRVRAEGRDIRRGIYRDFPTDYVDRLGNRYRVGFEVLAVRRDGEPERYHTERRGNGVRIRVGREERLLKPGVHTFTLRYRTSRQLGFFDEHDELYWNVTGNDWAFPIREVRAAVSLPDAVPADAIRAEGYTGYSGDTGQDYDAWVDAGGVARFSVARVLAPGEGFTLVAAWPKGYVTAPDAGQRAAWFLRDNAPYLIGLIGLVVLLAFHLIIWRRHGRDPEAGVIIPRYEPPPGYSPASMRFIRRMGYDHKTFAAALVNLAVNGLIDIDEERGKYVIERTDKPLENLAPGERALVSRLFLSVEPGARKHDSLQALLEQVPGKSRSAGLVPRLLTRIAGQALLSAAGRAAASTTTDDDASRRVVLERGNHSRIRAALKAHEDSLKRDYDKIYFRKNAGWLVPGVAISLAAIAAASLSLEGERRIVVLFLSVWLSIWSIGVVAMVRRVSGAWRAARSVLEWVGALFASLFALPFVAGEIAGFVILVGSGSPAVAMFLVAALVINLVFYQLLKAPTRAGRLLLDQAEGFRLFLDVAEKDEMNFRNPPEKTPELFERYLPHALAMDVEIQWAERFAGLFRRMEEEDRPYRPDWYRGSRFDASNLGEFSSTVGESLGSAIASSSTAPGSSSGTGGGGSSGGGGGGGGGGGW